MWELDRWNPSLHEAVLKLCEVECDRLPQRTAINEMLIESRSLAHIQLADALTQSQHNTLHSDGTTKFGHKYTGYQVATHTGALTLASTKSPLGQQKLLWKPCKRSWTNSLRQV